MPGGRGRLSVASPRPARYPAVMLAGHVHEVASLVLRRPFL